ncbi:MAG TPA: SpoIIE family protein phosphatase [Pirellulales bacterium]|nr:SpoIIE family protein phosphatase [Pirellulales bacterium]
MARPTPSYLKLYNEARPASSGRLGDFWPGLDKLCRAFERATGWPLQCIPEPANVDADVLWSAPATAEAADGEEMRVGVAASEGVASSHAPVDLQATVDLAATIGQLLADLARARQALWKREAELAAGVPLPLRTDEAHLAERLRSSLRAAAQAIGGRSAALYLLDETTSYLKLRSVWGLPQERLLLPPRELAQSRADLEALLGHAIVLGDDATQAAFQPPEPAAVAVCVPVSSATAPLGTLWVFGDRRRPVSDRKVNMLEVVAGRIAADLEREMLVVASADTSQKTRQFATAERWQDDRLPHVSPSSDVWQLAGWTQAAGDLHHEFYDWFVRADDSLVLALGGARQQAIEAALTAASLRTCVRAHAGYSGDPAEWLGRINEALANESPGEQTATLFAGVADAKGRTVRLAAAGELVICRITGDRAEPLAGPVSLLGSEWAERPKAIEVTFEPGDVLVVLSEGAFELCRQTMQWDSLGEILATLKEHREQPASILVELVHDRLTALAGTCPLADCTALVLKRRS